MDWPCPTEIPANDEAAMTAVAQYSEPFYAECRAYGRLQESGYEELSVKCFGYVLLDEDHERALMKLFGDNVPTWHEFCGNAESFGFPELRERFMGEDQRPPPLRALVKEFGRPRENFQARDFRRIFRDIVRLQQLGIICIDVSTRQIINDKICEFSMAVTTPHYLTTPELNPSLTPEMISHMEFETFLYSIRDYWEYDNMIRDWLEEHNGVAKRSLALARPFPNGHFLRNIFLRPRPYMRCATTFVNPRLYNWKLHSVSSENRTKKASEKRRKQRIANKKGGKPTGVNPKSYPRLSRTPPRWYFKCTNKEHMEMLFQRPGQLCTTISWEFKDGHLFPLKGGDSHKIRIRT
jgi:hypothetical protein